MPFCLSLLSITLFLAALHLCTVPFANSYFSRDGPVAHPCRQPFFCAFAFTWWQSGEPGRALLYLRVTEGRVGYRLLKAEWGTGCRNSRWFGSEASLVPAPHVGTKVPSGPASHWRTQHAATKWRTLIGPSWLAMRPRARVGLCVHWQRVSVFSNV